MTTIDDWLKDTEVCILKKMVHDDTTITERHIRNYPYHPLSKCYFCDGLNKDCDGYRPMKKYRDTKLRKV